ncbi:hypothetical protein BDZ85DRAFT_62384 [Elsinoe ampelina]|uniref:Peptidase M43 pregnancy-associated plasma-A domain-containing protein n=1 Tax=Elsinoe ampelina TaxID=302913 RepID=A0A6A6G0C3_9PEZI|nr:hypothetical protein BDZ85DRAFT_62384 [Elsinoe ampelina]
MRLTIDVSFASLVLSASAQTFGARGTRERPVDLQRPAAQIEDQFFGAQIAADNYTIETFVHVITTQAAENEYPRVLVDAQIQTLNERYAASGFSSNTASVNYYVNDTWARCYDPFGEDCQLEFKSAFCRGTYSDLNLYYLSDLLEEIGLLGYATFPGDTPTATDVILDGAVNLAATLTGAGVPSFEDYDLGLTTVHKVGHWLGLLHTFQGFSCTGAGDQVDDTPQRLYYIGGCPARVDSCPDSPGDDPIKNYMDYTNDFCKDQFSPGQHDRMQNLYSTFRLSK